MNFRNIRFSDPGPASLITILVYAGFALSALVYLVPPLFGASQAAALPVVGLLPGDLPGYVLRFALTFVLFGLIPVALVRLPGLRPSDLGLRASDGFLRSPLFLGLLGGAVVVGVSSAYSGGLGSYYPYSHTLLHLAVRESGLFLILHLVLYFVFYYIPWEIFFRGLLVLPFVRLFRERGLESRGFLLVVACFQIIPSALIHFGHPPSEMLSAVIFGVLAGWLVLRTRSILPGLLIHAAVGLSLDTAIYLRAVGVLPGGAN